MSEIENEEATAEALEPALETTDEAETSAKDTASLVDDEPTLDEKSDMTDKRALDEKLIEKIRQTNRLLLRRNDIVVQAAEEKSQEVENLKRAIKLACLKPWMTQKEMSELLGISVRELDALLAKAEKIELVARKHDVDEPDDKRKVAVYSDESAEARADTLKNTQRLVPTLADDEIEQLVAKLDAIIEPLEAMDMEDPRTQHGARDNRGPRGGEHKGGFGGPRGGNRGDRGGRGNGPRKSDDRSHGKFGAPRMGFGGSRGGHSNRGGYGERSCGGHGSYGDRGGFDKRNR